MGSKQGQNPGPWDEFAKPNLFDNCWYAMSKFRPLHPEAPYRKIYRVGAPTSPRGGIEADFGRLQNAKAPENSSPGPSPLYSARLFFSAQYPPP